MDNEVTVRVDPGICGMKARLTVRSQDNRMFISVDTDCQRIRDLVSALNGTDMVSAATTPILSNPVVEQAGRTGLHPCCVIPVAIIKAAEICSGLALARGISVAFEMEVAGSD